MGWIGCLRCEKFRCDFVARTFALIAPVQPVLHQASCSKETIQNARKHYEIQQYMNLGSNGVGRLHSLRKIPNRLYGTNLCINCTCQSHFAPRRTKTIVKGQWSGSGAFVAKNSKTTSWHKLVH